MKTGLQPGLQAGLGAGLTRLLGRLGEPVIRRAVDAAMRMMGEQFVCGRDIDEALRHSQVQQRQGFSHSFDMLGEAAMTFADAERYRLSYEAALARLAREAGAGVAASPGISVKLSALHPKYTFFNAAAARAVHAVLYHSNALLR
jgi:RHH-type proline utilization regulon transcriptional repressor/proline dehydrogenase/delta 1-pyrroline-5-carboxylate dehydrogenase